MTRARLRRGVRKRREARARSFHSLKIVVPAKAGIVNVD